MNAVAYISNKYSEIGTSYWPHDFSRFLGIRKMDKALKILHFRDVVLSDESWYNQPGR